MCDGASPLYSHYAGLYEIRSPCFLMNQGRGRQFGGEHLCWGAMEGVAVIGEEAF